jgi:AbiU2
MLKPETEEFRKKLAKEVAEAAAQRGKEEIPEPRQSTFRARMQARAVEDKLAEHGPGLTTSAIKITDELEFRSLLEGLAQDIVDAHIHWYMWISLTDLLPQWADVQVEASTFWHYTRSAHLRTALASLARAFDQEQRSLHLKNWLVTIGEHRHLFTVDAFTRRLSDDPFAKWLLEDVKELDIDALLLDIQSCSIYDPDVRALFQYRSNVLAHRGAKLAKQGSAAQQPQLDTEQIERLLNRAKTILNHYSLLFNASAYSMRPVGHDDVEHVFRRMQRDIDHTKQEIEAQAAALQPKNEEL